MSLPEKFSLIPLESHDVGTFFPWESMNLCIDYINGRFLVTNGVLGYVKKCSGGVEFQSFRSSKSFPKKKFVEFPCLDRYTIKNTLGTQIPEINKNRVTNGTITFNNGSSTKYTYNIDYQMRRPYLLLLPPPFSRDNVLKLKVGDSAICPVLEFKKDKKFPHQTKMAKPLLYPDKEDEHVCSMVVYTKPLKITRIYSKENYARVMTPDGPRFYHLGCLIEPLAIIPYL